MTRGLGAILVGGLATRMGGALKGLLATSSGETVVERTARLLEAGELDVLLVGDRAEYDALGRPRIADDPRAKGPLAGVLAALTSGGGRPVVIVGCDMPYLSAALVDRLLTQSPSAAILAAERAGRWEPLFARYDPTRVLPIALARAASGELSLKGLLQAAGAEILDVDDGALLDDWDTPDDVAISRP